MSPTLLTIEQAAERLNVSPNYVRRRLVFEKRIPYVKIGKHVRIEEAAIETFIEEGRVQIQDRTVPFRATGRSLADIRRERITQWRTSASTL